MKSYINAIATANPGQRISQKKIGDFLVKNTKGLSEKRKATLQKLYDISGIDYRNVVIEDFGKAVEDFEFFPNENRKHYPTTKERLQIFKKISLDLALELIEKLITAHDLNPAILTHIIFVSSTGMYNPGLGIKIIDKLKLSKNIHRTDIVFMGCSAAVNALNTANAICCNDSDATVLILDIELCSIHYQIAKNMKAALINAIFSDGASAIIIGSKPAKKSFEIESFHCDLVIPESGKRKMDWNIGDSGIELFLSSQVPVLIENNLRNTMNDFLSKQQITQNNIDYYILHPGGKRIIDACQNALGLTETQVADSWDILKNYGNLSSVGILFILEKKLSQLTRADDNKKILGFAFGPGLCIEGFLLNCHCE